MKLSTAIREGAKLHEPTAGIFFDTVNGETYSCALGACAEACGYDVTKYVWTESAQQVLDTIVGAIPNALDFYASCPVEGCDSEIVEGYEHGECYYGLIAHLNDDHEWTREAIADWLESVGY